jgi:dynein light chain roadblock-type
MINAMQQTSLDDSFAHLSRLSQKAGVQATLILSRETGAIVRSSGLVSRDESSNSESTLPASNGLTDDRIDGAMPNAEHVAEVVWKFAKAAGDMLQELSNSPDDDVKLLRLRSRNKEFVIFPGTFTQPMLLPYLLLTKTQMPSLLQSLSTTLHQHEEPIKGATSPYHIRQNSSQDHANHQSRHDMRLEA